MVLGVIYSGLVWGVLPLDEGISWQAHLFGAIGGVAAGTVITSDDPPALRARKQAKRAQKTQAAQAPQAGPGTRGFPH